MSKADALAFITRNQVAKPTEVVVINSSDSEPNNQVDRLVTEEIISLTAMESGLSLSIKLDEGKAELFYPYVSI